MAISTPTRRRHRLRTLTLVLKAFGHGWIAELEHQAGQNHGLDIKAWKEHHRYQRIVSASMDLSLHITARASQYLLL